MFSLFGSGFSVKYLYIRSLDSYSVNLNTMYNRSIYLLYSLIGCLVSVSTSLNVIKSFGSFGKPANSLALYKPITRRSRINP